MSIKLVSVSNNETGENQEPPLQNGFSDCMVYNMVALPTFWIIKMNNHAIILDHVHLQKINTVI